MVSYFVTARYKGQDNRDAFIYEVMAQLAELLGQPVPAYLPEDNANFTCCACSPRRPEQCQRLVLVVDGLDEDRGVTRGPNAYSIAALLPARPPTGLRVIVSGRPDPPIPADVPDVIRCASKASFGCWTSHPQLRWSRRICSASSSDCYMVTSPSGTCSA